MDRGAFLTIEGLEGAGKSSSIDIISDVLIEKDIPYIRTREPGGTLVGENVRNILLSGSQEPMQPMTELLLMFACRAEHIARVIEPQLSIGTWVVCDRFTDSSFAYQGGGRGLHLGTIQDLENLLSPENKTRPYVFTRCPGSRGFEKGVKKRGK